ncbi:undecaprenyl-diphosphate phosphatase [Rhodospirillaceae bacterium SYSU D60014]|uniref:undecaprenyl-diphosphate phosphatase n=1 Tax=Virgifigura deserti TaxID=2268457 RepID=UPI000E66F558
MPTLHIFVLALVQGITEFLPISSSGHLILVPYFTGWPDQGQAIDVATHVGTLLAVLVYFWRDIGGMLTGLGRLTTGRMDPGARLAGYLLIGTIPALVVGFLVDRYVGNGVRQMEVVAWALIGFGILLYIADRIGLRILRVEHLKLNQAIVVGCAQAFAFIPGTSRSGVTMTAARLLGYERAEAARFSFLLSIPAISAAGLWEGLNLYQAGKMAMLGDALLAAAFSAVAGFLAIAVLMQWLRRASFAPFVIYRLLLGGFLLYLVYA